MNSGESFQLHPAAAQDIQKIWEYIAADSISAASRIREQILAAIRSLVAFPEQGHVRDDLTGAPLRFRTIGHYLIAYAPKERPTLVVAVLDGRRNPRVLAAILRGRPSTGLSPHDI